MSRALNVLYVWGLVVFAVLMAAIMAGIPFSLRGWCWP